MTYEVELVAVFRDLFQDLDEDEKRWIRQMILQLKVNAYVGKRLRKDWFREKKYKNKRLYYLIFESAKKVLLVSFATKKDQDWLIEQILMDLELYKKMIENAQSLAL